jgi:hypothetical protein
MLYVLKHIKGYYLTYPVLVWGVIEQKRVDGKRQGRKETFKKLPRLVICFSDSFREFSDLKPELAGPTEVRSYFVATVAGQDQTAARPQ